MLQMTTAHTHPVSITGFRLACDLKKSLAATEIRIIFVQPELEDKTKQISKRQNLRSAAGRIITKLRKKDEVHQLFANAKQFVLRLNVPELLL